MQRWQVRIAPSLGDGFAGTPYETWHTIPYASRTDNVVFFGCYGLPDFMAIRAHSGRKALLWAGSDILHLANGYWLDDEGEIRVDPKPIAKYLNKYCENWCENKVEYNALKKVGIKSKMCPSFLGDVNKYEICYRHYSVPSSDNHCHYLPPIAYSYSSKPKVYSSVSSNDFRVYGWDKIEQLAREFPDVAFYLYGNTREWKSECENITVRGRLSQSQMNEEIKDMQGAMRMTEHDGFSEILAKSVLWGQYPISLIPYPHMLCPERIGDLNKMMKPNTKGRNYYLKRLNQYPWNANT